MASYINGITDYIPAAQPFQPDYNFLGNMLQNAQTKYDANYKALNKTYGTLLNSPMLREDNIQKRDEFFKMIDQDIKKISGMDLSLQQNVDAANSVFDSFWQNKGLAKDMVFTKGYQKQLEVADNYRNCIDQEKCGGKYWEEGANALHYRADEFKKASPNEAMTMDPGRFTPMINVQEKATKYAKDLFGSTGAFGVSTVTPSKDGKYQVTLKNGQLLSVPLQQLLLNQYGKDQDIIDMYNTQAYVNRKSFIAAHAAEFGGDEDQAEDAYFAAVGLPNVNQTINQAASAQALLQKTTAKKNLIDLKVKNQGSTGDDELSKAVISSNIDYASAKESSKFHDESTQMVSGLADASDRKSKRNAVDRILGRSFMTKGISDSAISVAALTGQESKEADPYALQSHEFALDMKKMAQQYSLMDENERRKQGYDLAKQKALIDYKKRGSLVDNAGTFKEGTPGTSTGDIGGSNEELQTKIADLGKTAIDYSEDFSNGYANTLLGVLSDGSSSKDEADLARATLIDIYGLASKGKAGFDPASNQFRTKQGELTTNPSEITDMSNWKDIYSKSKSEAEINSVASDIHKSYLTGEGSSAIKNYDTSLKLLKISTDQYHANNKNVKDWGLTKVEPEDVEEWKGIFRPDNSLKTYSEFSDEYVKKYSSIYPTADVNGLRESAKETYDEMHKKYDEIYNAGETVNGKPLVQGLNYTNAMGRGTGGYSAGGSTVYTFDSSSPALTGTHGLLSSFGDAQQQGTLFSVGIHGSLNEAIAEEGDASIAKIAYNTLLNDVRSGYSSKSEKDDLIGQVEYGDVALGDKNKVLVNIKPSLAWLKQYQGKKDEKTWADDPRLVTEGITMYVDKNKATNSFTKSFKQQPYDIIIDHQDVVLSDPAGGNIKINKRDARGNIYVQGMIHAVDETGGIHQVPLPKTQYNEADGGQNIYNLYNSTLSETAQLNQSFINSVPKQKIRDVNQLPAVRQVIQEASGQPSQPDLTNIFLQNIHNVTQ